MADAPQDSDVRNLVDEVLAASLRGDLPDEPLEEIQTEEKPALPPLYAIGACFGDDHVDWLLVNESQLKSLALKIRDARIVSGNTLLETLQAIEQEAGAVPGTSKICQAFGSSVYGAEATAEHILNAKVSGHGEADLRQYIDMQNFKDRDHFWGHATRISTLKEKVFYALPEMADLVSIMSLADETGGTIIVPRSNVGLVEEVKALLNGEHEVLRDDLLFSISCGNISVKKLTRRQVSARKNSDKRAADREAIQEVDNFVRLVRNELEKQAEAYLQAKLPPWAKVRDSNVYGLRKILKQLGKIKAFRRSSDYKNLFLSKTFSSDQIEHLCRGIVERRMLNEKIKVRDKFKRFVGAEIKRLKKLK